MTKCEHLWQTFRVEQKRDLASPHLLSTEVTKVYCQKCKKVEEIKE